jgi:transposase
MMEQLSSGQERLFYSFNLEDHIPANHLLRSIDRCLDLSDLRRYLADFYNPIGHPSIDPELMIRMLIVSYCYGIRSERRLCEEAHLNLAYRWFCRLRLEDDVPNHSTFSKNRHGRFQDSDLFRWLFNDVLRRCMDAGLVKDEGFSVNASIIKADASRERGVPGGESVNRNDPTLSTRAVREYLEALDEVSGRNATEAPVADGSSSTLDRRSRWPSFLRLLHELSDRYRARRDRGCGTHTGSSHGRGGEHQGHDRPGRGAVRHQAGAPHWRHCLRNRVDAGLDGRGKGIEPHARWPLRCRTCDDWPNLHLKGHRSLDKCVRTKQKTSN